jgi:electron transfer flavoprotein alpha subunit
MLAVVPVRAGVLPAGALETVAECNGHALLVGSQCRDAVGELNGVARIVRLAEVGDIRIGGWAHALATVLEASPIVVLPGSPDGRDLAPRLAAVLGRPLFAGAVQVRPDRVDLARRGGLVIEEVRPHGSFIATLSPGVRGVEPDGSTPTVEDINLTLTTSIDADLIEELAPDVTTMDLAEAPRILGGGAGLTSAEQFDRLSAVAARLGGSMGATRVLTDKGWVGHQRQIGTTGVVVNPRLYLAFGISGAVQHTSGLGDPDHVISVNTDPHCPMMAMADLAITADANATLEALDRLLRATR